ncbi:hypothetical protein [Tissierella sp.]|uniref:hypothetical protein n=1 Tax=Tissierella sp. TaxID=41274 RepID=UPI00286040F1|nr:hypothetical protein [Tissierella sp.]MDR7856079.1 hypothetical protein [Tissierella sp.]
MNEDKKPTPLSVMLGDGGSFIVKEKHYTIKPIVLRDIERFMKDNLSLGTQLFNITDKKSSVKVDNWLTHYCFDEEGNPVTLEKAMENDWDVVDLKEFFRKLCDFLG